MSALLTPRRKRFLLLLVSGALLVAAGVFFVFPIFSSNLAFYVTPGGIAAGEARGRETLRLGGMVQPGSLQRSPTEVRFVLADDKSSVPVILRGKNSGDKAPVLPDLFTEGKGAIAQGKLDASGTLIATEVLAKHDENYVPPNVHPQKATP